MYVDPTTSRRLIRSLVASVVGATTAGILVAACSSGSPPSSASSSAPTTSVVAPSTGASAVDTASVEPTQPSTPASTPARCLTANLAVTLGPPDGAAGSTYRQLVFTNKGSRTCTLHGFPGVSYVAGDDGHQVGAAAQWSGATGARVSLASGGRASAQLQLVNVQNFDPAVCRPVAVRGLRVYPPGEKAAVFVNDPGTGCAGNPPGFQLAVRTVSAS